MKIPAHIQDLQNFGVGDFTETEREEKVSAIKAVAEQRSSSQSPDISVVVPSFQEEKRILGTLMSLVQQTYENCEFILVDNEKSPGSVSDMASATGAFKVVHEPIKGIAAARQAGLEAANGRVIASTDADTLHNKDWLESIASNFEDKKTNISIGCFYFIDQAVTLKIARKVLDAYKAIIEKWITTRYTQSCGAFGANSAFLKSVMEDDLGGYDTSLVFGEDTDVLDRIMKLKRKIVITKHDPVFTSARRFNSEGVLASVKNSIKRRLSKNFEIDRRTGVYRDYR